MGAKLYLRAYGAIPTVQHSKGISNAAKQYRKSHNNNYHIGSAASQISFRPCPTAGKIVYLFAVF